MKADCCKKAFCKKTKRQQNSSLGLFLALCEVCSPSHPLTLSPPHHLSHGFIFVFDEYISPILYFVLVFDESTLRSDFHCVSIFTAFRFPLRSDFTTSPPHPLTLSPPHHLTTSPPHPLTTSPSHHLTKKC